MEAFRKQTDDPWSVYEEEIPSCSRRNKGQGVSLQDELRLEHLQLLWQRFSRPLTPVTGGTRPVRRPLGTCIRPGDEPVTPHPNAHGGREESGTGGGGPLGGSMGGSMGMEEFRAALGTLPDSEGRISEMEELFHEVDTSCEGRICWEEFCSYILQGALQRSSEEQARGDALTSQPLIHHCQHNKQEPVIRVVLVSQPPPLRFISISKGGVLSVWNRHLHLLKSLELVGEPVEGGQVRGRFKGWATDAVFMPNVHKLVVATLGRELRFFDVSTSNYTEEVHLFGLSNAVTSMCYWYDAKAPADRSLLMWGDEKGFVNLLWFLKPLKGLFEIPFSDQKGPHRLYMQDLCPNSPLVTYQQLSRVHQEPINRIKYESHGELIMTSSESATTSVVFIDLNLRGKSYIWKINKGVTSFDFCPALGLLVTGGLDPAVRLWNRYVVAQPVAALHGHGTTVLDVAIHQTLDKIFSYSRDAVLKIWDIPSQRCVRTLQLRFPCVKPGLSPEHGHFPFLLLRTSPTMLLVSCKDYLGCLRLQDHHTDPRPASLTCAIYNPHLGQVVTASADSSFAVWDVETGCKTLEVSHAHGEEELTCMALDHTHRHLLTGASNGTIKMWDLLNGHNLHKMEAVSDTEVTGIICFPGNRLLAVGWSQQIVQYTITNPNDVYVKADVSWKSGRRHRDDVLVVAVCPLRGLLATGGYDGEVIVWTLDTEKPLARLHNALPERASAPVDGLLFLQWRAQSGQWASRPLLLSSQAGYVCWWSVTGPPHCHGQFYAPRGPGECVLRLSSDRDNRLLVTGDTAGCVQVWDVSQHCLGTADGPTGERPPLLHSWKAHEGALVCVELVESHTHTHTLPYLLSASADGTARLWTLRGDAVGTFGQDKKWNLHDSSTYQCSRENWSKQTSGACLDEEEEEEEEDEEGWGEGDGESQSEARTDEPEEEVRVQRAAITGGAQRSNQEEGYDHATEEGKVPDPEELPTGPDILAQSHFKIPCMSPTHNTLKVSQVSHVTQQLQRRAASWRIRRQTFGRIDPKKLCLIDNICTPFQALIMPEMSPVSEAPRRPEMLDEVLRFSRSRSTALSSHTLTHTHTHTTTHTQTHSHTHTLSPLLSSCSPETTSTQGRASGTEGSDSHPHSTLLV